MSDKELLDLVQRAIDLNCGCGDDRHNHDDAGRAVIVIVREQIASLTRERDEARAEWHRHNERADHMRHLYSRAEEERDQARKVATEVIDRLEDHRNDLAAGLGLDADEVSMPSLIQFASIVRAERDVLRSQLGSAPTP